MSKPSLESFVRGVMSGETRGLAATSLRAGLRTVEPAYSGIAALRNTLFDRGLKRAHRLPRPVLSVGNLTTGGTGKTPFVQWLVRELTDMGRHTAILMRGYARSDGATMSDEERVLTESLPGCPVYADPDRVSAGHRAIAERPALDTFVLDDGFQHRRLARDLDIVLIDATNPLGYGHVLPRGMLRESPSGLRRANLIVITRAERVDERRLDEIEAQATALASRGTPIVRVRYRMDEVRIDGESPRPLTSFAGRRAVALSAIGNPQAFEEGLSAAGVTVADARRYADHHAYTRDDVAAIRESLVRANAELILTTEKDWAKLRDLSLGDLTFGRVGVRVEATERLRDTVRGSILSIDTEKRRV